MSSFVPGLDADGEYGNHGGAGGHGDAQLDHAGNDSVEKKAKA